jgi:hypothetical protein
MASSTAAANPPPLQFHTKANLLSLPTELRIQISSLLPYPDALALKHTNRHFYSLVKTGILLKVSWLLDRKRLHLEWPAQTCDFKTDESFCVTRVRELMRKRREHRECSAGGGGCVVVEGVTCQRERGGAIRHFWEIWGRWVKSVDHGHEIFSQFRSWEVIAFLLVTLWAIVCGLLWSSI